MKKENDLRIESKFALQKVMLRLCYEKTQIYNGRSFIYDCSYYKTEFENVYITDHYMLNDAALNNKTCIAFNKRTGKRILFTIEFLEQCEDIFKTHLSELNAI